MSELTKRVLFAVPAAIIMLLITWIGGPAFEILFGIVTVLTIWEIHRILRHTNDRDLFPISVLVAAGVWFFARFPIEVVYLLSGAAILLSISAFIIPRHELPSRWFATLFSGIYAPAGFLMIVYIRSLGTELEGFWLVLSFFLMIWGNDVFAYFGGKKFGKTPLAPHISPKKTIEGFWFGFLGSATGFLIVYFIADPYPLALWAILPTVLIIGFLGPVGDIAASRLKRLANVKDSSSILPGHGGFFDRFDSMILTAPIIYFLYYLLL